MTASQARSNAVPDRWRYAIALGVPLVALLVVILFGTPMFEGNDDTGLAMVGAGFGFAVEPEPHLIFSHFGYGLLLNAASRWTGPHAHGWATLAALGLSIGLFARAVSEQWRNKAYLVGATLVVVLGSVFTRALLVSQFTVTAALLFGAAVGCWLAVLRKGGRSAGLSVAICGAILLSFMIRPSVAALGLVVVGPALVWLAWRGPVDGRAPARRLVIAIAAIALSIYLTDKAAYFFSADWRDAVQYNQLRSLFNDYYRIPWIPGAPEYAKVGWSANDYAMFVNWYSLHPIFDYDNIRYLAQTLSLQAPFFVFSGIRGWLTALWETPLLAALAIVPVLLFVLLPRQRMIIGLVLIGMLAGLVVLGLSGRPPLFRVEFSALGIAILCTLPLLLTAEPGPGLLHRLGVCLLVGIGLYAGSATIRTHAQRVAEAAAYRARLSEVSRYFSGTVISWGATLAWEFLITPTTVYAPLAGVTIPSIGLFAKMPVMRSTLQKLGIGDLGATLCTQPDVRLIAGAGQVAILRIFCEQHYRSRPNYNLVFSHAGTEIYLSGQPEQRP